MTIAEIWAIIKARREFITWFTGLLLLVVFAFTLFTAGGVKASFAVLLTRAAPVSMAANVYDEAYDTFYALRAAELTTKMLAEFLKDPAFRQAVPFNGPLATRIFGVQLFRVYLEAPAEAAAAEGRDKIIMALNKRLQTLAGQDNQAAFLAQAADFSASANSPHWLNLLAGLVAGLGFSGAIVVMQSAK